MPLKTLGPGYRRYLVAWMTCVGLTIVLGMRCELGLAILRLIESTPAMVWHQDTSNLLNNTLLMEMQDTNISQHQISNNFTGGYMRVEFHSLVRWSDNKVGLLKAAFYVGYGLFSFPGGLLATFISAYVVFGMAVGLSCGVNVLLPATIHIRHGFVIIFVLRVIQGASEGCLYPAAHALWRYWAPVGERAELVAITFLGIALGPILGYPLIGCLIERVSWCTPFYMYGCAGLLWSVAWFLLVHSTPRQDPHISKEEVEYIESSYSPGLQGFTVSCVSCPSVPWTEVWRSTAVWAIVVANVGRNWIYQFSMCGLPQYFHDVYHTGRDQIGLALMVPFLGMAIATPLSGIAADFLCRQQNWATVVVRKLFNTLGFGSVGLLLLGLGFIRSLWGATAVLTLLFCFVAVGMCGYGVNHLDIAPQYAGMLMGLSNGLGTVSGVLAPLVSMCMTRQHSAEEWCSFFILSGLLEGVCVLFYLVFAEGEVQPWAMAPEKALKERAAGDVMAVVPPDEVSEDIVEEAIMSDTKISGGEGL